MNLAIGSDHAGFETKQILVEYLRFLSKIELFGSS